MKCLAIFLIFSILLLGCSALPSEKTTPTKTPTPIPTTPSTTETELGIEDIQKELEELEKLLSEPSGA